MTVNDDNNRTIIFKKVKDKYDIINCKLRRMGCVVFYYTDASCSNVSDIIFRILIDTFDDEIPFKSYSINNVNKDIMVKRYVVFLTPNIFSALPKSIEDFIKNPNHSISVIGEKMFDQHLRSKFIEYIKKNKINT